MWRALILLPSHPQAKIEEDTSDLPREMGFVATKLQSEIIVEKFFKWWTRLRVIHRPRGLFAAPIEKALVRGLVERLGLTFADPCHQFAFE